MSTIRRLKPAEASEARAPDFPAPESPRTSILVTEPDWCWAMLVI